MKTLEFVLTEDTPANHMQTINGLCAKYRGEYTLTDVYLFNGKGKIVLTEKQKDAA